MELLTSAVTPPSWGGGGGDLVESFDHRGLPSFYYLYSAPIFLPFVSYGLILFIRGGLSSAVIIVNIIYVK